MRLVRHLHKGSGTSQGTIRRVADRLGYGVESVRMRVKQSDIDSGDAAGISLADRVMMKKIE
ncbi:hypothetical protein BMS3Bbin01_02305 [bacterium BMS3Bbin01]|nr:hypothetical protein BMS3Bbin01_02305 [bacterium BMS3Bbin01]